MRFIVFGDSKGKENGINKKVLHSLMKESSKLYPSPEFILVCGDSVAGGSKEETLAIQLMDFRDIISKYHPNKSLFPVIGNHEVNINPEDDRFEQVLNQFYRNLTPTYALSGYNNTVYCIDFDDTRLIILNSFHPSALHKIDKVQLNWFKSMTSVPSKNKLVFIHSPAFPTGAHLGHSLDLYPEDRNEFWDIVDKCNIDVVFSGHEHNYSRRVIDSSFSEGGFTYQNKVPQIISGGGGEKLRNKYKSKKGIVVAPIAVYHFLVVDIDECSIKVSAITSKGKKIDEFEIKK